MTTEPKSMRVVVADDDAFTVSLVSGGLSARGFAVATATSVAEALAAVGDTDPHALITDLNFGSAESGADLLSAVAEDYPWVGLVVLTSHRSPEPGHTLVLADLGLSPLLDLGLRLGEGSGAALALPIMQSALALFAEMATFDDAGVADRLD